MEFSEPKDADEQNVHEKANIKGDRVNILLLLIMYILQGSVYGLLKALPIVFQNRNIGYAELAEFSFVRYPTFLKILMAPIIDCYFFKKFGRRKTWIIPSQYLMGLTLLFASINLDDWLSTTDSGRTPRIHLMTAIFSSNIFFSSVQDIALDGWSLTMLEKRNIGYAGTCQFIGVEVGMAITFFSSLVLDSKNLSNVFRSIPQNQGFVNFADSMFFWSILFLVSNTFIFILKKDNSLEVIDDEKCTCKLGLRESYWHMWKIFKLRAMLSLSGILLMAWMGSGPLSSMTAFKMIENGVPKDRYVLLSSINLPFKIISSVLFRRSVVGPESINSFIKLNILLLIMGVVFAVTLGFSQFIRNENDVLPMWYTGTLILLQNVEGVIKFLAELSLGAFFFRISDPRYGGIYLALMATINNIGKNWPQTLSLWCVDFLKIDTCSETRSQRRTNIFIQYTNENDWCVKADGFFVETIIFTVMGIAWLWLAKKQIYKLVKLDVSRWRVKEKEDFILKDEWAPVVNGSRVS